MEKNDYYTGIVPLEKAMKDIVINGFKGKHYEPRKTIKKQKYEDIVNFMKKYSKRFEIKNKKILVNEKPIFPTTEDIKEELNMTVGEFFNIIRKNGDKGRLFTLKNDISREAKEKILKETGIKEGLKYVILKSQYSSIWREEWNQE